MKKFLKRLSERGESLQTAMISIIVSSVVLLGVAGGITIAVQQQGKASLQNALTQESNNIDTVFRTDVTKASIITPTESTDTTTALTLHIPQEGSGACDFVTWRVTNNGDGTGSITRSLQTYTKTLQATSIADRACDTTSSALYPTVVEKSFSEQVVTSTPAGDKVLSLKAYNPAGRELAPNPASKYLGSFVTDDAPPVTASTVAWRSTKATTATLTYTIGAKNAQAVYQTVDKVSSQSGNILALSNSSQWAEYELSENDVRGFTGQIAPTSPVAVAAGKQFTLSYASSTLACATVSTSKPKTLTYTVKLYRSTTPSDLGTLVKTYTRSATDTKTITETSLSNQNTYYTWQIYGTCANGLFSDTSAVEIAKTGAFNTPQVPTVNMVKTSANRAKVTYTAPSTVSNGSQAVCDAAAGGVFQYRLVYQYKNGAASNEVLRDWTSATPSEITNLVLNVAQRQQVQISSRCFYKDYGNFSTVSSGTISANGGLGYYLPINRPSDPSLSSWGDWGMGKTQSAVSCEAGSSPRYRLFQGFWNGGGNAGDGWAVPGNWDAAWGNWKTSPQSMGMAWKWGSVSRFYNGSACAADTALPSAVTTASSWVENANATTRYDQWADWPGYGHWWNPDNSWQQTPNDGVKFAYGSFTVDVPSGLQAQTHWAVWANGGTSPSSGERWSLDGSGRHWHGWVEPYNGSTYRLAGKWGDVRLLNPETGFGSPWVGI